jgi:ribosomal protein L44E
MKIPKKTKRFCPYCKKRTEQKVKQVSTGAKKGALTRGAKSRVRLRGQARGMGSMGKYSKRAGSKWKKKTKTTKKAAFLYTCLECNKSKQSKKGIRTGKLVME